MAVPTNRNESLTRLMCGSRLCLCMQRERSLPLRPPCLGGFIRLCPCPPVERPQRARNLVGSAPSHRSGTKPAAVKATHRHLAVPDGSAIYKPRASTRSQPSPRRAAALKTSSPPRRPRHLGKPPLPRSSRAPGLPGRHLRTGTRPHQGRCFQGHPPPPPRIFSPSAHSHRDRGCDIYRCLTRARQR